MQMEVSVVVCMIVFISLVHLANLSSYVRVLKKAFFFLEEQECVHGWGPAWGLPRGVGTGADMGGGVDGGVGEKVV